MDSSRDDNKPYDVPMDEALLRLVLGICGLYWVWYIVDCLT